MHRRPFPIPLLIGLIVVAAVFCVAAKVKTFPGRGADFSRYKTYEWLPTRVLGKTGLVDDDASIAPVLRRAVAKELAKHGLVESNGAGDLQVSVLGMREASAQLEAVFFSSIPDVEWGTAPIATMGRYNYEGALVVNLIDSATKKTAWAGIARKAIGRSGASPGDVENAAASLFKKYPK